ncbi:unnamed protein product [Arabidopsis thaliana]|uniref:TIR domain-containing protein n=1 Tax=Arabidopsis thaliana TaxID=3702 RepID=A0A5S9WTW0_ARATH|nr:unnamed protein product [Arabidopsis thaliana]
MSSATATYNYDVFLSFRGPDTRRKFISFLYKELVGRDIRTFKDDKELENGQIISPELRLAIEDSRFAVVVVSENYAASSWCLNELVEIMEVQKNKGSITVMPIFYDVKPSDLRRQTGVVAEQFTKHEAREQDLEKVLKWRQALAALADISGDCSGEDDSELVDVIADKISKELMLVTTISNGRNLVGIDKHMKELNLLMDLNSNKGKRMVGIWGNYFESHLHKEFVDNIKGENSSKQSLKKQKVLLVADDVDKLEQLDALAGDFNGFGPGSVVIITTKDKQLLISYGIQLVYEAEFLTFQKFCRSFRSLAFKKRDDISAAFEWALYI